MTTTKTTPTATSAQLKRLGFKPLPVDRARQWGGLTVHRSPVPSAGAVIDVHTGDKREVDALGTLRKAADELVKAGYVVDGLRGDADFASVYVVGREPKRAGKPGPKPGVAPKPRDRGRWAQDVIMDAIAVRVGYWQEDDRFAGLSAQDRMEMDLELRKQADRVARLFGFEKAWVA